MTVSGLIGLGICYG